MGDEEKTTPAILWQILIGWPGLAVIHGLVWLLTRVSFGLAMAVAIFGSFGVAFTLAYRHLMTSGLATFHGLLATYLGAACVLTTSVFQLVPMGGTAAVADVSKAPKHSEAGVLVFESRGKTLREYKGTSTDTSGKYDTDYLVHPVVPEGWRSDQPVPLWQGSESASITTDHDNKGDAVAVVVPYRDEYDKAIADATQRHELKSAPAAPVIRWVLPEVLEERATLAHGLTYSAYLLWLLGAVVIRVLRRGDSPGSGA